MDATKQFAVETISTLLRNKYVLLAVVILGLVGPGVVRLASMLHDLQHH